MFMPRLVSRILSLMIAVPIGIWAQTNAANESRLGIRILDPTGAVIAGATIELRAIGKQKGSESQVIVGQTGAQGEFLSKMTPGNYKVVIKAAGFEPYERINLLVKAGDNRLEVKLKIKAINEETIVTQTKRERQSEPGGALTATLTEAQIALLPDDPEQFEAALRRMAGPGAIIRVDGFAGGTLPPKSQIREIRFRLNPYSADNHDASQVGVDIITKPGIDLWHGTLSGGIRNESLSARNAFAPIRGSQQYGRFGITLGGPLWRNRTSLFLSGDAYLSHEPKTIVAALPEGPFTDVARQSSRALILMSRLEHSLTKSHTLRAQYHRNAVRQENLGVGDFDLPDRGYSFERVEHLLRLSDTGPIGRRFVNELRFEARWQRAEIIPAIDSPAILVPNAFSKGGAQIESARRIGAFQMFDDLNFVVKKHSLKAGFQAELLHHATAELFNATGTFTFASLDRFRAGTPTTFVKRTGDPLVDFNQYQFGWYLQDDIRLRSGLSISVGLRQEFQTHLKDRNNFAPRVAFAWSPLSSGNLTIRGGAGVFYSWFDADAFDTTLRVDGRRQSEEVVVNPGFPDPLTGGNRIVLPPSRIQQDPMMRMPTVKVASIGAELQLAKKLQLISTYVHQQGVHLLRSHNINVPINGVRPNPDFGNILQVESTAHSRLNLIRFTFMPARYSTRLFWIVNYMLSEITDEADGAFSLPADNFDLRPERGPSSSDSRHQVFGMFNMKLVRELRLGTLFHFETAKPYNVTTGFDDNGDTISNDRPRGVGRNSARGAAEWDLSSQLSWAFGFGKPTDPTRTEDRPVVIRGKGTLDSVAALSPDSINNALRMQIYLQAFNLFNHANPINFVGVRTSPFFGKATAALPGRRLELGMRFSF